MSSINSINEAIVDIPLEPDDEDSVVEFSELPDFNYGDRGHGERGPRKASSIRLSALPDSIRAMAKGLDKNGDGDLSLGELAFAFDDLEKKTESNKQLKKIVIGMVVMIIALVACTFAASITAVRFGKEFTVSTNTGLAYKKDKPVVMKTGEAIFDKTIDSIGALSNDELGALKSLVFDGGNLKFIIKGYSRDPFGTKVIILVEGGQIVYDSVGIVDATGSAKQLLEKAYGPDAFEYAGKYGCDAAFTKIL